MNAETALLILYVLTACGLVVWCVGLRFLVGSFPRGDLPPTDRFETDAPAAKERILGSAEVEGRAADLTAQAAAVLAKEGAAVGQLRILERTDDRVTFAAGGSTAAGKSVCRRILRGQLHFTPLGRNRTRIEYEIELSSGRALLLGGAIFQLLGLIALIVGFWVIHRYVVPNPHPAVRWQTLQMLQASHFLWPPFLFGGLNRGVRVAVRNWFETLVHNLPYCGTDKGA